MNSRFCHGDDDGDDDDDDDDDADDDGDDEADDDSDNHKDNGIDKNGDCDTSTVILFQLESVPQLDMSS